MEGPVAVVGAGLMGHGIAHLYARAGIEVRLCDTGEAILERARREAASELDLLVEEGVLSRAEAVAALSRIHATTDLAAAVAGASFVTEAVPEVLDLKWEVYDRIERAAPEGAVVASNTSTIPVARLAERSRRPGRMVITHFFNPPHLVPLVEVAAHPAAPPEVLDLAMSLMRRIGRHPVHVRKEVPGFVANRLQAALLREALHLLELGVADAGDIDAVVSEGPGVRWPLLGPLAVADLGGLDVWRRVLDNLLPELGRAQAAPDLVADHVRRGELGAKTGRGLFEHGDAEAVARRLLERDRFLVRLLRLKAAARPPAGRERRG